MYANYHTHTKRCQHAVGEDREYVEAAIAAGIQVLGFSDHCPWVYKDDFVSGIRMRADQVEEYVDSMQRLRTEYRNDIRILIGFETEHMPDLIEAQDELLAPYPIDYMILGQHFLKQEATEFIPVRRQRMKQRYRTMWIPLLQGSSPADICIWLTRISLIMLEMQRFMSGT